MKKILSKVDDIVAFIALSVLFFFPIARFAAALGGTTLISFDVVVALAAAVYIAWFAYVDVIPAIRKKDPLREIVPSRLLGAILALSLMIPYMYGDMSVIKERLLVTCLMTVAFSYTLGAMVFTLTWPKDYVLTVLQGVGIVKAKVQPLVLDVLNNNKKPTQAGNPSIPEKYVRPVQNTGSGKQGNPFMHSKNQVEALKTANAATLVPVRTEQPAKATSAQQATVFASEAASEIVTSSTIFDTEGADEAVADETETVAAVNEIEVGDDKVFEAATPVDGVVASEATRAIDDETLAKVLPTFVRYATDRTSMINKSAYELKSGSYKNFSNFNSDVRSEDNAMAMTAFKEYLNWLFEPKGLKFREEALKVLGL